MTIVARVNPKDPETEMIERAKDLIVAGKVIAYPTDTLYGLGANALDAAASLRIFGLKRRPLTEPLPVAVSDIVMAQGLAEINEDARRVMEAFWPGALTVILTKKPVVPNVVTSGRADIALRSPNHRVPLQIMERSKVPITSTSANIHGMSGCRNAKEVIDQFGDEVDLVLDGGQASGTASTILQLSGNRPRVLREGPITRGMLRQVLGRDVD